MTKKFDNKMAQEKVRRIAENSSCVILGKHAKQRMEERDINMRQVMTILRNGYCDEQPKFDSEKGNYTCKLTKNLDGNRDGGVVTAILKDDKLFIISVMWEDL